MLTEATNLAHLVMQSPADLVLRCRRLLGLLDDLGVDRCREDVTTLVDIDSDADRWPVGVDPSLLEAEYHSRCVSELRDFEHRNWPSAQLASQSILQLLTPPLTSTRLMLVEHVFELRGKTVLAPGVASDHTNGLLGALVRVVRPDGSTFTATVSGIEMLTPNLAGLYPIELSSSTSRRAVPIGSEVWTLDGS